MMLLIVSSLAQLCSWFQTAIRPLIFGVITMGTRAPQLALAAMAFSLPSGPRLAGTLALAMRTIVLTPRYVVATALIASVSFVALTALTNPYLREELAYAHTRSSAIQIFDAELRWLGILPPANFPDWSDGSILPADHEALPIEEIPPGWRACLVYLEDREFDGISRALGVDPTAILKSAFQTVTGERRRGASTLYMQAVRTLRGQTPDQRETPAQVVLRKAAEIFGANALVKLLENGDPQAAERFVAMHLPLVIGASGSGLGSPVHGIGLASRILFGVSAEALTLEQQAVLAAAVKSPILLALPSDKKGTARARSRWERVKDRADFCLRQAPRLDVVAAAKARKALAAMPAPSPHIDHDLRSLLPADEQLAWRITVNPARRAAYFAKHELAVLKPELARAVGVEWRARVVSVQLSTSAPENRKFVDRASAELQTLARTLPGLNLSLTNGGSPERHAHVVAACADVNGKLRRIYSSHEGIFWSRSVPIGSVAKIAAAVALGRKDTPTTGYCRSPIPGFPQLQDGKPCSHPSAWLSAQDAFARSDNYAVNWALRNRVSRSVLIEVANALRLPLGDVPPSTALTFGTFEMTPAEMLRFAGMIGGGISGSRRGHTLPSVVRELATIDETGKITRSAIGPTGIVEASTVDRVFSGSVRSYLSSVLQATSGDGGTLRRLKPLQKKIGVRLYAKTGTVSTAGVTSAIHVIGIAANDTARSSLLVSISAPRGNNPLGFGLAASSLSSALAAAVCQHSEPFENFSLSSE
jgi:membrane peptidoglycan carboxypeptidase